MGTYAEQRIAEINAGIAVPHEEEHPVRIKWPQRCVSTEAYEQAFPARLKRLKVEHLLGIALGPGRYENCYRVKWDKIATTESLHKQFFRLRDVRLPSNGEK